MADFDDETLREFLNLCFDAVCARPMSDFVDPDRLLAGLDRTLTSENFAHWQARLLNPLRSRLIERAKQSGVLVGAWLPRDVSDTLADLLGAPVHLPRRVIDEAVASEQVRDSVRTMLNDTLTNFLKGDGGGGGIGAAVGWGARAVGAAGRGLLGGIGDGIQRALQDRVRDFVDGSVSLMQKRIADKLSSDDTARAIGRRRRAAFVGALRKSEADVAEGVRRMPFDRVDSMVPRIVAHNLARVELREVIVAETRAVLEEISRESVGAVLAQAGIRELARSALHAHGLPVARQLVQSTEFAAWWAKVRNA